MASSPLFVILVYSNQILERYGQKREVCDKLQLYILAYMPGLLLHGLNDLQRKYLIQVEQTNIQKFAQIVGTFTHAVLNYVLILNLKLGLLGAGIAGSCSNLVTLALNLYFTSQCKKLAEANSVGFKESLRDQSVWPYLQIGLPSLVGNIVTQGAWLYLNIIAGKQSVEV